MALVKEQYAALDPLLSPGAKNFLESFAPGRWGLRAGRAARRLLRNARDPIQKKTWMGQFAFPLRNALLWNRPITIPLGDVSVQMVPEGSTARDTWTGLRCERQEISFLMTVLEPGMIFFDVGAEAGLFAISAAKKIGGSGVFAFEPQPAARVILERNVALNRVAGVQIVQTALGDPAFDEEKIPFTALDAFMKECGAQRVDVIRAGIEGAELMLFRGAKDLLRRPDGPIVLYEVSGSATQRFGYHPVEILWFLESCGYALFSLNRDSGEIAELKPDYGYDSMVIGAKPTHAAYAKLQARLQ
jgi:hypothetical protein